MQNKVIYQFIFEKSEDFDPMGEVADKIKEGLDYIGRNIAKEDIWNYLSVEYEKDIQGDKSVICFSLEFSEEILPKGDQSNQLFGQFNEWIKGCEKIKFVFKYRDDYLFSDLDKYYKEIFDIEMELREVISLIFIETYGDNFYNLLRDFDIKLRFEAKNKNRKEEEIKERFGNNLENEFFYLVFPDYQNFSKTKQMKIDDIISILAGSQDFKELQNRINKRGITKEDYVDFLKAIREDLDSIENIRNCVAHNRTPSTEEKENYEKAKEKIRSKINVFHFPI